MKLKSTLLVSTLMFFCASVFAADPIINVVVTPTTICQGDTVTIAILTSDTFPTGNVFRVFLAEGPNGLANPTVIASVTSQGNDTVKWVAPALANHADYQIGVLSSDTSLGLDTTMLTIHHTPTVSLQLAQNTFCTFTQAVVLTGGAPAGGVYSGTYVVDSFFQTNVSGAGTFQVYYTVTDDAGCSAQDTGAVTVSVCPSPSVSVQVSPGALCPEGVMNINIQTSDVLAYDNIFTVQLSDSSGSFASPTVLVSDTNAAGGTLQIATPSVPSGTHYKVRVVASDPATNGIPVSVIFKARLAAPNISLNATGPLSLCTRDTFKLKADSLRGVTYQWTLNGNTINVPKYTYTAKDSGLYIVSFTDTTSAGCSSGADSIFIGIYPYPAKPSVSPSGTVDHCGPGSVALSTPANNNVTFQWANHGQNISGATQNSYSADTTGVYLVRVTSTHGCTTKSDSVRVYSHANPVVTFNIQLDSFCLHSPPILLSGGSPTGSGGFYTGNYVLSNAIFDQTASGIGAFEVFFTFVDSIGCRATDSTKINIFDCVTSGINEPASGNQHPFEMFPNPASEQIHISTATTDNYRMKIFNLLGQELSSQVFNQQLTYAVNKLQAGVYLVEISDASNSWKSVKRLVIQ